MKTFMQRIQRISKERRRTCVQHKNLQVKYNNIKQKSIRSALNPSADPDWYKIVNPVFTDTNQGIDSVCSSPEDTSFCQQQHTLGSSDVISDDEDKVTAE